MGTAKKVSLHDLLFNLPVDDTTRRRNSLFSSTLVLPGLNVYEGLSIDDPEKLKWRDYVFRARGRDLKDAILDFASLPKVDFTGAELQGASLFGAQLQGASLIGAQLQGTSLRGVRLQGGSLDGADLQDAVLNGAELQGASLHEARLQGASIVGTQLQVASLDRAQLQGAAFFGAQLQGASFEGAELQGARLDGAQLGGASLRDAELQGASFFGAELQGASFEGAQLGGASLRGAQLQGASFREAGMRATDLSNAFLWRSTRAPPPKGEVAELTTIRLSDAPDTWRPTWRDHAFRNRPWNHQTYEDLRQTMEALPPSVLRDNALLRIRSLDCADLDTTLASCDPSIPPPPEAAAWQKELEDARVDDSAYDKALAAALKRAVCTAGGNAIYVLRGFLSIAPGRSRLADAGPEAPALVDVILSSDCPVSAMLTDADKADLLRIKQAATKPGG